MKLTQKISSSNRKKKRFCHDEPDHDFVAIVVDGLVARNKDRISAQYNRSDKLQFRELAKVYPTSSNSHGSPNFLPKPENQFF